MSAAGPQSDPVEDYVASLAAALHGPVRTKNRMMAEAREGRHHPRFHREFGAFLQALCSAAETDLTERPTPKSEAVPDDATSTVPAAWPRR